MPDPTPGEKRDQKRFSKVIEGVLVEDDDGLSTIEVNGKKVTVFQCTGTKDGISVQKTYKDIVEKNGQHLLDPLEETITYSDRDKIPQNKKGHPDQARIRETIELIKRVISQRRHAIYTGLNS